MLCEIVLGILLCWCSMEDIKTKKISVVPLIIGSIAIGVNLILIKEVLWINVMYGVVPGVGMIILAIFTTNKIGLGDGILVSLIGSSLGLFGCLRVLWSALVLITVAFVVIGIKNKTLDKTIQIPFVPFLSIGWVINYIYQMLGG